MDLDTLIMNGKAASNMIREVEREKNLKHYVLLIISRNCRDS